VASVLGGSVEAGRERAAGTHAFGGLDVHLDDATDALILGAHVGADSNELDRIAEVHLALWIHEALGLELLAPAIAGGFDVLEALGVVVLGKGRRIGAAGGCRSERGPRGKRSGRAPAGPLRVAGNRGDDGAYDLLPRPRTLLLMVPLGAVPRPPRWPRVQVFWAAG
jgi:hypothetical protein